MFSKWPIFSEWPAHSGSHCVRTNGDGEVNGKNSCKIQEGQSFSIRSLLIHYCSWEKRTYSLHFSFLFLFTSYIEEFKTNILKTYLQAFSLISITITILIILVGEHKNSYDSCYFGCQCCQKEIKLPFSHSLLGSFFFFPSLLSFKKTVLLFIFTLSKSGSWFWSVRLLFVFLDVTIYCKEDKINVTFPEQW